MTQPDVGVRAIDPPAAAAAVGQPRPEGASERIAVEPTVTEDASELEAPPVVLARAQDLDRAGRPVAGVPVGVFSDSSCRSRRWASITVGPDGIAELSVPADDRAELVRDGGSMWVAVDALLYEREAVEVELNGPPAEPIRLQLPECGSVRVRVERGGLGERVATLRFSFAERFDRWPAQLEDGGRVVREPDGAECVLPWVALDRRIELVADVVGAGEAHTLEFDGPTLPGEEVVVALSLDPDLPQLSGRLLDGAGTPLALTSFHAIWSERGSYCGHAEGTTYEHGSFELVGLGFGGRAEELMIGLKHGDLQTAVDLVSLLGTSRIELGDLVLAPPPVVVAGRVESADGAPIAKAWPRLVRRLELRPWVEIDTFMTLSGADGRFTIEPSLAFDEPLGLRVDADGWLASDVMPFERGATDVVVVLHRAATLQGSVVHDPGLARALFDLHLELTAPSGVPLRLKYPRHRVQEDGFSFEFRELPAGSATLTLSLDGDPEPLLVLRDAAIAAGETCRDERLQAIDLRGRLHLHRIEVVDARGVAVSEGWLEARPGGAAAPVVRMEFDDGEAELLSRDAEVDLAVSAPGFRTRELAAVRGAARVELEGGLALELALADDVSPLADEWFELCLVPAGMSDDEAIDRYDELPSVTFESRRVARVVAPAAGEYRLAWWIGDSDLPLADRAGTIRVADRNEAQRFDVGPDAAALAERRARD